MMGAWVGYILSQPSSWFKAWVSLYKMGFKKQEKGMAGDGGLKNMAYMHNKHAITTGVEKQDILANLANTFSL